MAKLVIKKRVSLDFLGEEYKEAYLVFQAVPIVEYEKIQSDIADVREDGIKSSMKVLETVKDKFVEGKFPNDKGDLEDVAKDDLDGLDEGTLVECFKYMTGQKLDPKLEAQ